MAIDVVAVVHAMEVDDSRRVTKPGLTKLWGLAKQWLHDALSIARTRCYEAMQGGCMASLTDCSHPDHKHREQRSEHHVGAVSRWDARKVHPALKRRR